LIGVMTTGLTETQGSDLTIAVKEFRTKHPEFNTVPVVPVATPDFSGCLESGYAAAVTAMIATLVPERAEERPGKGPGTRKRQVNILAGSWLTPGDVEALKETVELFGLRPVVLPDLSGSLDGHLFEREFTPLTDGGLPVDEIATLGEAAATLVLGASMNGAADLLKRRTGVPDHRFDTLLGLDANDKLMTVLAAIADGPVPERLRRQRAQLQDAMVDTHFMTGMRRAAIAADPDLLYVLSDLIVSMGGEVVAAVAPARAPILERLPVAQVKIGDLQDLEVLARAGQAELVIGNSHAVGSGERLGIPVLRAGFPQYDWVGGYQKVWIGYKGTREALFDLANLLLGVDHHAIAPYRSIYAVRPGEEGSGDYGAAVPHPEVRH